MSTASAAGKSAKTASVLLIGNELLSGRTKDANLPYLAVELNKLGIRVVECRVVPDVESVIVDAIHALRERSDYVFTTGGIGPTHDDITAQAVAAAFGRKVVRNAEAEALLRAYYPAEKINEARLKMADMPDGAALIHNPVSTAPGFRVENVYALAGVPDIARAMFDHLKHELVGGRRDAGTDGFRPCAGGGYRGRARRTSGSLPGCGDRFLSVFPRRPCRGQHRLPVHRRAPG